ncbi:hypothetical protein A2U01_0114539, partial [Trifolium medium]|nr:hypothetical protein [Trifolium medium]
FRWMKGRYNLREACGGWCLGQGSSETWTWAVILNGIVQDGESNTVVGGKLASPSI